MDVVIRTNNALHVAVLAFPFGSHTGPLVSLIQKIAESSPNVTFSFFSTAKSIASVFSQMNNVEKLHNVKPYCVHDGLPEGFVPSGHPLEPINLFLKAVPGNYRRAMADVVKERAKSFTCLVTDAFFWFGAEMAEEMDAKWVPLWTAGPHALLSHVFTDLLRQKIGCNGDRTDQNLGFLPGFSTVKVSDLPDGVVTGDIEGPFAIMQHKMGQTLPRASAVAINSFDALLPLTVNQLQSKFKLLLNVGPFPLTLPPQPKLPLVSDENRCIEWLNKHKDASVAYVSFGSVITPPPHELAALAEALEESEFPFIWSFRGNPDKQLPKGFLERTRTKGKVLPWAPQMEILKHGAIGVFVTHCGWNSILESIIGGVPMICRPFFGDQKLNTRILEAEWEIGVWVENEVFTKNGTVKALKTVLESEDGKVMRQKIKELQDSFMEANDPCGSSTQNFKTLMEIVTT